MKSNSINTNFNEIMTLSELAQYLKISEKSVSRMAHRGDIPVTKVASQWRFMRTIINNWLVSKMNMKSKSILTDSLENGEIDLVFSRLIKPKLMVLDLKPDNKKDMLLHLIAPLKKEGLIENDNALLFLLIERENMVSTALGNNIAIPHIREPKKFPIKDSYVVVGICKKGADFESVDGKKTNIFFLICTNSEIVHLKILARIANLTKNTNLVDLLINSKNKEEIVSNIIKLEQRTNINF